MGGIGPLSGSLWSPLTSPGGLVEAKHLFPPITFITSHHLLKFLKFPMCMSRIVAKGRTGQAESTHQNRLGGGELPYWAVLGRSWGDLGAALGGLGPILGDLGAVLGGLGPILGDLGALLGGLGAALGGLGAIQNRSKNRSET